MVSDQQVKPEVDMNWSIYREVKAALDSEDIEGLLAIGAPSDEYKSEASLIEDAIAKATQFGAKEISAAEIESIVRQVWNQMFGPMSDEQLEQRAPAFRCVAAKLKT